MDIHKPKPWHGWPEFLKEIGTIVIGVLIALGAEQAAELSHWAKEVREAKASIHDELALASVFAEERLARKACGDAYLDELAAAVAASPAQWEPRSFDYCGLPHKAVYTGFWRPWPTEVWQTIEAGGAVAHFDAHYRLQAPFVFNFVREIGELSREERRLASDLSPLGYRLTMTPDTKVAFLRTIAGIRAANDWMAVYSRDLNGSIGDLGETPTAVEMKAKRAEVPVLFLRPGVTVNN
ncbi:MAG: hypothetical protein ACXWKO_07860 [Phenylobacterium sp.]